MKNLKIMKSSILYWWLTVLFGTKNSYDFPKDSCSLRKHLIFSTILLPIWFWGGVINIIARWRREPGLKYYNWTWLSIITYYFGMLFILLMTKEGEEGGYLLSQTPIWVYVIGILSPFSSISTLGLAQSLFHCTSIMLVM